MARKKSKTTEAAETAKAAEANDSVSESVDKVTDDIIEAEVVDDLAEDIAAPDDEPEPVAAELSEPIEEPADPDAEEIKVTDTAAYEAPPEPTSTDLVVTQRKGGFVPMVLGGIVAAGIGFGSAIYLLPQLPESWLPNTGADAELVQRLDAQGATLAELKAALAAASDDSALQDSVSAAQASVSELANDVAALKNEFGAIGALEARMTELEKAPIENATPEAVAAYTREMEALQAALASQRAEVEAMAAEAAEKNASAEMTAQDALKRSAMSQILTSLETGSGYGEAVDSLTAAGIDVPSALAAQAEGAPTVDSLKSGFVEPAREALAAARKADGGGGFSGFLKTQLGARSLEPREGDDPDAVLSRVEAAVKEGRLGDALAEASALPEEAQTPLKDWTDAVKARQAAVEAAEALSQQINTN